MMPGTVIPNPFFIPVYLSHMARYVITDNQTKEVIHKYLDKSIINLKKEENSYDNRSYNVKMYNKDNQRLLYYIWYAPGGGWDDDDDTVHNGVGSLQVHPSIVDLFRQMFKLRETKILDIITEWVDNKVEDEVDEVTIYPYREKPPVY